MRLDRFLRLLHRPVRPLGRVAAARMVLGVWLAVHGFVVAAAPVADALAGHRESVVAHWEDAQDTSCPPQHDAAACQLCQQVVTVADLATGGPTATVAIALSTARPARDAGLAASDAGRRGSPEPRGPPRA